MKLSDYILKPREERIAHIDLSTPCNPVGSTYRRRKHELLMFLGVTDDIEDWRKAGLRRCHACATDTTKGCCLNPLHLYVGTGSENWQDFARDNPDNPRQNGLAVYRNPRTGEPVSAYPHEAEVLGYVGLTVGRAAYIDPVSGDRKMATKEEALSQGLKHVNAGTAGYKDPNTGETCRTTAEDAKARGLVSINEGLGIYKDPVTGDPIRTTVEDAKARGLTGVTAGRAAYKDPETGETFWTTAEDAKARGLVGANTGIKMRQVVCPHCGREGSAVNMKRWHFDNCAELEGSPRWLKAQERRAS